jgi:hypothetical protein
MSPSPPPSGYAKRRAGARGRNIFAGLARVPTVQRSTAQCK